MKRSTASFKSDSNNLYLYSPFKNQVFLAHPIIVHMWELENEGTNIETWIEKIEKNVSIEKYGFISKQELLYYFEKYQFYKENNLFSAVDVDQQLIGGGVTPEQIKVGVANLDNVCFEVTEECSLNCSYCTYGDFYTGKRSPSPRTKKTLDVDLAKKLLVYLDALRNSNLNRSDKKKFLIGFYGGEPLLNMDFIKEIVQFVNTAQSRHKTEISFGMTSNGTEIDTYMDFLVKNNFSLTISLDGDKKNNGHRVFHNGEPSFSKVMRNINLLKTKYPKYFEEKVFFNSVLHNKNSIVEIHQFFKANFNKVPSFSEVAPYWVKSSKKEELKSISKSSYSDLKQSDNLHEIQKDMFSKLPPIKDLTFFLHRYSTYVYKSYRDFFAPQNRQQASIPQTGTCIPFERKLFVSATGKLLPCENVGHGNYLDHIDDKKTEIDFHKVAEKYNGYLKKMYQCQECFVSTKCEQCMFNIVSPDSVTDCSYFESRKGFSDFLSVNLSAFENKPNLYRSIMRKVRYV